MHIKLSLNILFSRYGIIFKMIAYCTIALLFLVTIAYSIAAPILSDVIVSIRDTGWADDIHSFFTAFLNGEESVTTTFRNLGVAISSILNILMDNQTALINAIAVFVVFGIVAVYVLNLANLTYSDIINHFMNSNSRFGFVSNFLYNLKKSAIYSLLYMVTKLPLTILVYAISGLVVYAVSKISWMILCLPLGYIVWIMLTTLVHVLFMGWAPAITADGIAVHKAINEGCKVVGKHFNYSFMNSFMASLLSTVFVSVLTATTFGAGILIAIPTTIMFRKILELVLYYSAKNYKFYSSDSVIVEGKLNS